LLVALQVKTLDHFRHPSSEVPQSGTTAQALKGVSAYRLPRHGSAEKYIEVCRASRVPSGFASQQLLRGLTMHPQGKYHTTDYLGLIGVADIPPCTSPFDPGYDPITLEGHLQQSSHLISILKISMACWMVADENVTRRKIASAREHRVATVTGGGPFEIAVAQGQLPAYLDLCADIGVTRIECGEGFTDMPLPPSQVTAMARQRGLEVQFELGKKHGGAFELDTVGELIDQGRRWLDAGAVELIVEARESAKGVGLFDVDGNLNCAFADRFVEAFGVETVTFEAPNKPSQFALLDHFGNQVRLSNVRLEELLRVEIYRRGLHSDAFGKSNLRPRPHAHKAA
jgi:phosphosulfolactate synthase